VLAEVQAIWQLTLDAYLPDRDRIHPPSGVFKESVDDVRRAIAEGAIFVALRGDDIVGAARVRPDEGDTQALYCGRLAVLPAEQGAGIGSALMQHIEDHAREAGFTAVTLGARLELSENVRFYLKRGYRVVREESHAGYTTPTFAWMRKEL